mgnify:CR=1 FL=1
MKRLYHRKSFLIVLGIFFLSCTFYFSYLRDKVIVVGNRPFNVSRLDSFIENTNKGNNDKVTIIAIKGIKNIERERLSVDRDKIILMSSGDLSDKCRVLTKTINGKDISYTMLSAEKQTMYILLHYKKLV